MRRYEERNISINAAIEQVIGREGETATFLKRSLVNSELRGCGFALRQLRRSAFSVY